jgi:hypothetical protein
MPVAGAVTRQKDRARELGTRSCTLFIGSPASILNALAARTEWRCACASRLGECSQMIPSVGHDFVMFGVEKRNAVRLSLLGLAEQDKHLVAAAEVGSLALGVATAGRICRAAGRRSERGTELRTRSTGPRRARGSEGGLATERGGRRRAFMRFLASTSPAPS